MWGTPYRHPQPRAKMLPLNAAILMSMEVLGSQLILSELSFGLQEDRLEGDL